MRVETHSQAQYLQDQAAEKSSITYRPPELFQVASKCDIDERTDIWVSKILLSLYFNNRLGRTRFVTRAFRIGDYRVGYQESGYAMGLAGAFKKKSKFDLRTAVFFSVSFRPKQKFAPAVAPF